MNHHSPNFLPQIIEGVFYEVFQSCDRSRAFTFNVIHREQFCLRSSPEKDYFALAKRDRGSLCHRSWLTGSRSR